MGQRLAFAATAGLVAFVIVVLGAVGAYVALGGTANTAALAAPQAQNTPVPPSAQVPGASTNAGGSAGGAAPTTSYPVSADAAATIALNAVPGATLMQPPRLVNVNGTVAYEVALDQGYVYIDATTGQVLYGTRAQRRRPRP